MKDIDFCALKAWKHFQATKVSSTMQIALEASLQYPEQQLIITAEEQTAGRGRYNRMWASPPGNFYGTFVMPYKRVQQSPLISYGVALAVLRAVGGCLPSQWGEKLSLKWPNDILLADHKIAGVLLDVHEQTLFIGIGVNLAHFPPQTSYPATSIGYCTGIALTPLDVLVRLVDELDNVLAIFAAQGFEPIRLAWLAHRNPLHQTMRITQFYQGIEKNIQAEFIDLNPNGLLQVRNLQTQAIHEISAGDIFFKK